MMKNITISMPEELIKAGRKYAKIHHTSFNALIRELVKKTVIKNDKEHWIDQMIDKAGSAQADSKGYQWNRQDAYDF